MSKAQASRRAAPATLGLLLSLGCSSSGTVLDVEKRNSEADGSGGSLGSGGEDLADAGSGGSGAGGSRAGSGGILMEPPGAGGSPDEACAAVEIQSERLAADLLLLVDTSSSMAEPSAPAASSWSIVTDGISRFLADPRSVGHEVGLQIFPKGGVAPDSCTADYQTPEIAIGPTSDVSPLVTDYLSSLTPAGLTPTGPALAGAIAHMRQRVASGRSQTVVLLTDGLPSECTPQSTPELAALAAEGRASGVATHVVTLREELGNYSSVAEAGSLGTVHEVDISRGAESLAEILARLAQGMTPVGCAHTLPTSIAGTPVDIGFVNVSRTTSAGRDVLYVLQDAAECASVGGRGWYREGSAETGYVVHLCEAACGPDTLGISIVFGCSAVPPPP